MANYRQQNTDTCLLSEKLEQYRKVFNDEILQLIPKIKKLEEENAALRKSHQHNSTSVGTPNIPDRSIMEDIQKKEKHVYSFFFKQEYSDVLDSTRPPSVDENGFEDLLISFTKHHYVAAKDICLREATFLLERLFRYQRQLDDDEEIKLEYIGNAYKTLMSCIPKKRADELCSDIRKQAIEKLLHNDKMKKMYEQCLKLQDNYDSDKFMKFIKGLTTVSFEMVTVSPPMIVHLDERNLNKQWLHFPVSQPLHWVRPVILKNFYGMPLVQGIAENCQEMDSGYVKIG